MSRSADAFERANRIVDAARALQADPNDMDRRRDYMQRVFNVDRAAEAWIALAEAAGEASPDAEPVAWASDEVLRLLRKHVDLGVGVRAQRSETWRHPLYARPAEGELVAERLVKEIEYSNSLRAMVGPMYAALVEARDLLLERIHGNPARSAAHNARLRIESALASLTAPKPEEGETAGYCKACGTMRSVAPCRKCGGELKAPHPDWEEPPVPDVAPIRALAREVGYAIGEHWTKERDLDLIAVPWREGAASPQALAEHIAKGINGVVLAPEPKPAGRWSCNIQIDGWFKIIDLSVMPTTPPDAQDRMEELEARAKELEDELRGLLHGLPEILENGGLVDEEGLIEKAWMTVTRPEAQARIAAVSKTGERETALIPKEGDVDG